MTSVDRLLPLEDEAAGLALNAAFLALTALLFVAFVALVHLPAGSPRGGVVGWISIHHYSRLAKDVGSEWFAPLAFGERRTIANTQSGVRANGARMTLRDHRLTIDIPVALSARFAKQPLHVWSLVKPATAAQQSWVEFTMRR